MFTDWLIFLDYLEENNYNTYLLRLATPIFFSVSESNCYINSHGLISGNGKNYASNYSGRGENLHNGDGLGYGWGFVGDGCGDGDIYYNPVDEDH